MLYIKFTQRQVGRSDCEFYTIARSSGIRVRKDKNIIRVERESERKRNNNKHSPKSTKISTLCVVDIVCV